MPDDDNAHIDRILSQWGRERPDLDVGAHRIEVLRVQDAGP